MKRVYDKVGCLFSSKNDLISEEEEILKDKRYTEDSETNDSAFSLMLSWHGTLKWSDIRFESETVIAIPLIITGACYRSVPSDKVKGQNQLKRFRMDTGVQGDGVPLKQYASHRLSFCPKSQTRHRLLPSTTTFAPYFPIIS